MKRHAKALPAGSNSGLGTGLGSSRFRSLLLLSFAIALVAALTASPALAAETHPYTGTSFGPDGTTASSFNRIGGVAVDPANGNVYVYDSGFGKVYKFDSAGNPVNFSGLGSNAIEGISGSPNPSESEIAIAPPGAPGGTAGDIYLANASAVRIYAPSGEQIGELNFPGREPCGVATSPSGHVFVGIFPSTITEFIPSANPVTNEDEEGASSAVLPNICNVAADGLGNVYAANFSGSVVKLAGLGAENATPLDQAGATLAVDPSSNDVYVDRGTAVAQYDSSGNEVNVFGSGRHSGFSGIAVNGASEEIYVGNGKSRHVDVFGPLVTVATVTAKPTTAISSVKATLNALIDPEGVAISDCKFEYASEAEYEASGEYAKTAPCEGAIPTDSSDHPVTAALSGLEAETTYHFQVIATDANGRSESDDQTFTTARAAASGDATEITGAKATLNGVVFPEGEAVSECFFEYGTTTAYGKTAACEGAIPTDEGEHPVKAALTHLVPNGTAYHFRLVIKRPSGIAKGADSAFETAETVITGAVSAINPPTATVEGLVNPEGILYTECKFEYGPTSEYGSSASCTESPAAIGEGTTPVSVHANLGGLAFEASYHYRLVAANADGTAKGQDRSFKTPGLPLIEDEQVIGATETKVELSVLINPKGLPTTYHLEYGADTSYGQSTEEAEVGGDETGHTLTTTLEDLTPGAAYHWRAVAINSHGVTNGPDRTFTPFATFTPETSCANQAFRIGASARLPDCRAYEMVSPPRKAGEVIPPEPVGFAGGSCRECLPGINGQGMPMQSAPDGESILYMGQPFSGGLAAAPNEYLAHRAASGWETQSLSPPLLEPGAYQGFSADLTRSVLYQEQPALSPEAPTKEGKSYPNIYVRDADGSLRPLVTDQPPHRDSGYSADSNGFRIVYGGANSGTASAPAFSHVVFEATDALTTSTPTAPAAVDGGANEFKMTNANLYEWVDGQLRLVNVQPGNTVTAPGAVIGAGKLLFASTVDGQANAVDHAISADGSRIFWSEEANGQVYVRIDGEETQKVEDPGLFLTASADGTKVLLNDGCLYDLQAKACEDLSPGPGEFEGSLGAAEDLSRVYFVDTGVLTGGDENIYKEHAEAGKFNLYAWDEGAVTFIGTLTGENRRAWQASRPNRSAQVSPDGSFLTFMAGAPLSGETGFSQVYEYAADSGTLTCASCSPTGQKPLGGSNLSWIKGSPASPPLRQPGNISADGDGRLFFESRDTLSPRDLNGRIQDVYEWEPNGVGGCERAKGCVSLISSGQSANDSMFVDSTPSGNDVFFITREQLLLRDKDEQLDLYDARVGGGIDENSPPPCLGEACKGPASSAPEQSGPGSSTFSGPGNEKPKAKKHKKKHRKHAHKQKSKKRAAKHNSGGSK